MAFLLAPSLRAQQATTLFSWIPPSMMHLTGKWYLNPSQGFEISRSVLYEQDLDISPFDDGAKKGEFQDWPSRMGLGFPYLSLEIDGSDTSLILGFVAWQLLPSYRATEITDDCIFFDRDPPGFKSGPDWMVLHRRKE